SGLSLSSTFALVSFTSDSGHGLAVGYTGPMTLRASAFLPSENVTFAASSDGLFAPTTTAADTSGGVILTTSINRAVGGAYTLTATGQRSGLRASLNMVVADVRVSPAQFQIGDTRPITITESGFQAGEFVRLTDETCGNCAIQSGIAGVADDQ